MQYNLLHHITAEMWSCDTLSKPQRLSICCTLDDRDAEHSALSQLMGLKRVFATGLQGCQHGNAHVHTSSIGSGLMLSVWPLERGWSDGPAAC